MIVTLQQSYIDDEISNSGVKKIKHDFTYENLKKNPHLLVGKNIKHKWKYKKKALVLRGKVIGITANGTLPDDSDTEIRKDEICFDLQYIKYKNQTYHYRILPDLKCNDLQVLCSDTE